jgi:hypothetical protein
MPHSKRASEGGGGKPTKRQRWVISNFALEVLLEETMNAAIVETTALPTI